MKVVWTKKARKAVRRHLDPVGLKRRIDGISNGFEGFDLLRLQGRAGKAFRIRIGSTRVLIELEGDECRILDVVDRKDAY